MSESIKELDKQIERNYGTFTYLGYVAAIGMALDIVRDSDLRGHPVRMKLVKLLMKNEQEVIAAVNARTQSHVGKTHKVLANLERVGLKPLDIAEDRSEAQLREDGDLK